MNGSGLVVFPQELAGRLTAILEAGLRRVYVVLWCGAMSRCDRGTEALGLHGGNIGGSCAVETVGVVGLWWIGIRGFRLWWGLDDIDVHGSWSFVI